MKYKISITILLLSTALFGCKDNASVQKQFISDRDRCVAKGENFMGIYFPLAQGNSYYINPKDQKGVSNTIYCECMKDSEWVVYGCPKPKKEADAAPKPLVPTPAPIGAPPVTAPMPSQPVSTIPARTQAQTNEVITNRVINNQTVNTTTTNTQNATTKTTTNDQVTNRQNLNDKTINSTKNFDNIKDNTRIINGQPVNDSLKDTLLYRGDYEKKANQPDAASTPGIVVLTPPPGGN